MRYVTLRHSQSGKWCVEAPHPTAGVPQPHYLPGVRMTYATLRAATKGLNEAGFVVVKNTKDGKHYIYSGGRPLAA